MNKKNMKQLDLVRQSTEGAVYRTKTDDNPLFFYFRNNILVKVDRGQRGPDVIIQNDSRRLN
jgi:hypothetical protein